MIPEPRVSPQAMAAQKYAERREEEDDSAGKDSWKLMLDASLGVQPSSPSFFHTQLGYAWKMSMHWHKFVAYRFDVLVQDWRYKYLLLMMSVASISFVLTGLLKVMISLDCDAFNEALAAGDIDENEYTDNDGYQAPSYTIMGGEIDCEGGVGFSTLAWIGYAMVMEPAAHLEIDSSMTFTRAVAIAGALFGILMFSIITGVMVDKVSRFLLAVDQGMSAVVERNHHIILGWTSKGPFLLDELCRSMESEGGGKIAILSPMLKMDLQKTLAELQEPGVRPFRGSSVVIRQGDPFNVNDLRRVAAPFAKTICILASPNAATDANRSDMGVMRTVLAIKSMGTRESLVIIPELKDFDNVHLINITGGKVVEPIVGHDVIAHLLVKAVKIPHLGAVYGSLLGFDGSELYFCDMPRFQAKARCTFKELLYCSPDTILIGIRRQGKVILNPDDDLVPDPTDELVVIAEDDSLITFQQSPIVTDEGRNVAREIPRRDWAAPPADHILVCGWRRGIEDLLMGLDRTCRKGSTVTILSTKPLEERLELFAIAGFDVATDVQNIELIHAVGDSRVKRHLLLLHNNNDAELAIDEETGKQFVRPRDLTYDSSNNALTGPLLDQMNRILIVANEDLEASTQSGRGVHSDSQCIATLIVIREIQKKPRVMESLRSSKVDRRALLKRGSCGFDFEKYGDSLYSRSQSSDQDGDGKLRERTHIVCEVLDSNTQKVVSQSRTLEDAADWCVSNDLVAKLLAMVMENRELASLIQELVGHEGQQLYVHPAKRYVQPGEALRFWDVMMRVRIGGEIALGYITSNAHEHGGSGGGPSIVINPANKSGVLRLRPNVDYVVTLGYNTDVFSSTGQLMGGMKADKGGSSPGKASPLRSGGGEGNPFTRKAAERMATASERMKQASDSVVATPGFEFTGHPETNEEAEGEGGAQ